LGKQSASSDFLVMMMRSITDVQFAVIRILHELFLALAARQDKGVRFLE
jgi:hypothetical protein